MKGVVRSKYVGGLCGAMVVECTGGDEAVALEFAHPVECVKDDPEPGTPEWRVDVGVAHTDEFPAVISTAPVAKPKVMVTLRNLGSGRGLRIFADCNGEMWTEQLWPPPKKSAGR